MIFLYDKYSNYARVGHEMGRAASTVSKYIKMKGTPKITAQTLRNNVRRELKMKKILCVLLVALMLMGTTFAEEDLHFAMA